MRLTDKKVCEILGNKSIRAYKYGSLKPKIDKIMDELSLLLEDNSKNKIVFFKKELIKYINETL